MLQFLIPAAIGAALGVGKTLMNGDKSRFSDYLSNGMNGAMGGALGGYPGAVSNSGIVDSGLNKFGGSFGRSPLANAFLKNIMFSKFGGN